jgi:hypothetical protein
MQKTTHDMRQTGNRATHIPDGPRSRKIYHTALGIKEIAARIVDHPAAVEELTHAANVLLAESQSVAELETNIMLHRLCVRMHYARISRN